jgi:hypothetical protein
MDVGTMGIELGIKGQSLPYSLGGSLATKEIGNRNNCRRGRICRAVLEMRGSQGPWGFPRLPFTQAGFHPPGQIANRFSFLDKTVGKVNAEVPFQTGQQLDTLQAAEPKVSLKGGL